MAIRDMDNPKIWPTEQTEREITMLGDKDVVATIAVKDLATARKFYGDTLGLTAVGGEGQEVIVFRSGKSTVNVYRLQHAGTNKATAATWVVGEDVDNIVRELKAKGVKFEHYDFPGMKREGDVHVAGKIRNAWFKDPDWNILSVVSG
jgi:extradiol dioxygenase family protein